MKKRTMLAGSLIVVIASCSGGGGGSPAPTAKDVKRWCTYAKPNAALSLAATNQKGAVFFVEGLDGDSTPISLRHTVKVFIAGVKAMKNGRPASARTIEAAARIEQFVAAGCKGDEHGKT